MIRNSSTVKKSGCSSSRGEEYHKKAGRFRALPISSRFSLDRAADHSVMETTTPASAAGRFRALQLFIRLVATEWSITP
jgi:hypothetical protein